MKNFNEKEWLEYREQHKDLRYWQALRNYMEVEYLFLGESDNEMPERQTLIDTFYIGDN